MITLSTVQCAYCLATFDRDDSQGQAGHWLECEKHPARAEIDTLRAENERLKAKNELLRGLYDICRAYGAVLPVEVYEEMVRIQEDIK